MCVYIHVCVCVHVPHMSCDREMDLSTPSLHIYTMDRLQQWVLKKWREAKNVEKISKTVADLVRSYTLNSSSPCMSGRWIIFQKCIMEKAM